MDIVDRKSEDGIIPTISSLGVGYDIYQINEWTKSDLKKDIFYFFKLNEKFAEKQKYKTISHKQR